MLKVFWLKKYSDEIERSMYRSYKPPKNITTLKITDNSTINCLTFTNPKDSNCIYTLHDLQLVSSEKGLLRILSSDDLEQLIEPSRIDNLQVSHGFNMKARYTELASSKTKDNLFKDHYAIILPGGSIIVETDKDTSEVNLSINWSVEEF